AKYIAETYFDHPVQRNGERGMLGYSGEWEGTPVSVQATGMGCPSAAIVMEELVQLGVKRFLRVGTCGGLQPDLQLGDLIVAVTAVAADGTARHYVGGEPHTPTADWELVHGAVHAAKELDQPVRVGAIASSDTFYDPDPERHKRWSERGVLGVEMEAAVLFTIGALRSVKAGCLLTVSEIANGIAELDVELAVIPRGTGWDFVRTYGIPRRFDDAVKVALGGQTREIDLGRARYRGWDGAERESWFANVASAGMSGAIAKRANESSK